MDRENIAFEYDKNLFLEIINEFSGYIRLWENIDMSQYFLYEHLRNFEATLQKLDVAEKSLHDSKANESRIALFDSIGIFIDKTSEKTYLVTEDKLYSGVPKKWRDTNKEDFIKRYKKDVSELNALKNAFLADYYAFLNIGKEKLFI